MARTKIFIRDGTKEANRWMASQLLDICKDLLHDDDVNNVKCGEEILGVMNKYGILNDKNAQPFKNKDKMIETVKEI